VGIEHVDHLFCQWQFCHWFRPDRLNPNMARDGAGCKSMPPPFTISDLRQRPEFFDTVADRIWQAWWQESGHPLAYISTRLRENMEVTPIPFALVAHDGEKFLGTASVIASDLEERPQLTPWVAAVWVEEAARRRGAGAALVNRAAQDCFALGITRAYLCARPRMSGFYERLGWTVTERKVGRHQMSIFIRDAGSAAG
jgi:N-acetylglutamate synthase-like GNAT family acetyltransferase